METPLTSLSLARRTTQILQKKPRPFVYPTATPSSHTTLGSSAATTVGTTPGTTPGNINGSTIQVRSSEDGKKDLPTKIGQAKGKFYFIRVTWCMAAGAITHVDYSLLSKSLLTVHNKPWSALSNLMQSMLKIRSNTANVGPASSLFTTKATIHVVQKKLSANLLHGNLPVAKVGDLWGSIFLLNLTTYLPQLDMVKVECVQKEEQARTNKMVIHVSEAKLRLPKTSTENIGYIRTVKHFTSRVVNTAHITSTCANVATLEKKEKGECLLIALSTSLRLWVQTL